MCKDDTFTANTCLMSHTGRTVEPMEPWNCTIERLKSSLCGIREVFFITIAIAVLVLMRYWCITLKEKS
jgi:hypothetical protein